METRRQYSPEQKVAILREHLIEHTPVSDLCDKHQIHPTLFYQWQKAFFENGAAAFAGRRSRPPGEAVSKPIRFQREYFPRIEEVRRALRSEEKHQDDTFIGTVERLDGEIGADGRRAGEVVLALLLADGETVRARANLTSDQYLAAYSAHMTEGAYIKVAGKLSPGRQPRSLMNIVSFEQIFSG